MVQLIDQGSLLGDLIDQGLTSVQLIDQRSSMGGLIDQRLTSGAINGSGVTVGWSDRPGAD